MTSRGSLPHNSPLYRIVQHQLFEALASGEWQPNQAIPSEKKLCERFGVSIGTLRKAIDVLVAEHILVRQQGLGTFVANHNRPRQFFQFFNVAPHEGARTYPTVELLSFSSVKSDRVISEKLAIPLGSDVFRIKNLLSMESQPVVVDTIVLPASLFKGLSESVVKNRPSTLYNLYLDVFAINVIRIDERVRAGRAPIASAKALHLQAGDPILEVRRVALTFNQKPIEWRISHVNTNHYEYVHREALDK